MPDTFLLYNFLDHKSVELVFNDGENYHWGTNLAIILLTESIRYSVNRRNRCVRLCKHNNTRNYTRAEIMFLPFYQQVRAFSCCSLLLSGLILRWHLIYLHLIFPRNCLFNHCNFLKTRNWLGDVGFVGCHCKFRIELNNTYAWTNIIDPMISISISDYQLSEVWAHRYPFEMLFLFNKYIFHPMKQRADWPEK